MLLEVSDCPLLLLIVIILLTTDDGDITGVDIDTKECGSNCDDDVSDISSVENDDKCVVNNSDDDNDTDDAITESFL